jgi:hypothetical protein
MDTPKLLGALALALVAALLWFAFLRRTPEETATGVITHKVYKPAGTYTQQPVGTDRGFRVPTNIPIAEGYLFGVRLDDGGDPVGVALNEVSSRQYEVGQRVRLRLTHRGLPPLWQRAVVLDMTPADGTP